TMGLVQGLLELGGQLVESHACSSRWRAFGMLRRMGPPEQDFKRGSGHAYMGRGPIYARQWCRTPVTELVSDPVNPLSSQPAGAARRGPRGPGRGSRAIPAAG